MSDQVIKGGKELDAMLASLAPKIEKNILRAALRSGAVVFRQEAKSKAPVDSGALRKSIKVSVGTKKGRITAKLKVGGKLAPHAMLVEYGTKPHKIAPKGAGGLLIGGNVVGAVDHPGAKPHPFVRPTFDEKSTPAIAAVAAKIRERLTREGINVPAPEVE